MAGIGAGFDLMPAPGLWPLALTTTTIAMYGCVPETDQLPAIALMTLGLAGVEAVTRHRSEPIVFVVAAAIVLWAGLYGATGRASAIVGAWFAFWPVVIVPVVAALCQPSARIRTCWLTQRRMHPVIAFIGALAAIGVARTGAIQPTVGPALLAVAIAAPVSLAASIGLLVLTSRHRGEGSAPTPGQ